MALIAVVAVLTIGALLSATLVSSVTVESVSTAEALDSSKAFYIAQAGIDHALHTRIESSNVAFAGGEYTTTIISETVRSVGTYADATRVIEVSLPVTSGVSVGLALDDKVDLKDDVRIDSFDSSVGPYLISSGSSARVSTNSTSNKKLKLKDDVVIEGDAYCGVGGTPSSVIDVKDDAEITGSQGTLDSSVDVVNLSVPSLGGSAGDVEYSGSSTTTLTTDMLCKKLDVKDSATLEISGDVTIVAEKEVKFDDSARLVILAGSTLTLHTEDKVEFKGDSELNVASGDASRFILNHASNKELLLDDDTKAYVTILAPSIEVLIKGDSEFFGIMAAKRLKAEGDAQLHVDLGISLPE